MTTSIFPTLQADPALVTRKKRVLLVDSSRATRDLRSETMRRLGAEVDCAADIAEARCWWRADLYNLVLMNVSASPAQTEKFCDDIRRFMPGQRIMFLVGRPDFLAAAARECESVPQTAHENDAMSLGSEEKKSLSGNDSSQRWGILEACRRISVVRSKMDARTKAMRARPDPARDSEGPRGRNDLEYFVKPPELVE
ncbi:MAG TPA: response regulator [Terriglobales bacterium]|nr:response regulator [Terriglobales bacterium]